MMSIIRRIDNGRLLVDVDGRRVVVRGEPLRRPSGAVFGVYPVEAWQWEDGTRVKLGDILHPRASLHSAGLDSGMPLDLEEVEE